MFSIIRSFNSNIFIFSSFISPASNILYLFFSVLIKCDFPDAIGPIITKPLTSDFEKLLSLGVFNAGLMNDAVYKFKRYEDSSLTYMGYAVNKENRIGLFDTVIKKKELVKQFINK